MGVCLRQCFQGVLGQQLRRCETASWATARSTVILRSIYLLPDLWVGEFSWVSWLMVLGPTDSSKVLLSVDEYWILGGCIWKGTKMRDFFFYKHDASVTSRHLIFVMFPKILSWSMVVNSYFQIVSSLHYLRLFLVSFLFVLEPVFILEVFIKYLVIFGFAFGEWDIETLFRKSHVIMGLIHFCGSSVISYFLVEWWMQNINVFRSFP